MTTLAFAGLRRAWRANPGLAVRFVVVFVFFPLAYYFSHPETYYFRPVDPLIVVLAAYFVAERFGSRMKHPGGSSRFGILTMHLVEQFSICSRGLVIIP
jgi:hypothetical protein